MSSSSFININKHHSSNDDEEDQTSSFLDDFSDGVYEALESKTCKLLIFVQFVLMIAIVCVTLNITQYRVIDLLSQAYQHVKHDFDGDHNAAPLASSASSSSPLPVPSGGAAPSSSTSASSFAAHLKAKENELPRVLGRKLGAFIYKKLSTAEDNAAIFSGSLPILLAKLMTSPLGKASASASRVMTYSLQILKEYYPPPVNLRAKANTWMWQNCNFSSQYPYPQVYDYPQWGYAYVYCKRSINLCCGVAANPQCRSYYEQNTWYCSWSYYINQESSPIRDIYEMISTIRSYVAPVMYTPQLPAPASISSRTEAMSVLSLTKMIDFIDFQGDLSSYKTMGGLSCHKFIDDARKLNWNFNFMNGDGTQRNWNLQSNVDDVLKNMEIVCNKMAGVNNTAALPPAVPANINALKSSSSSSSRPKKSTPPTNQTTSNNKRNNKFPESPKPSQIVTITIASLIVVLSLVLVVILIKSLFGWLCCGSCSSPPSEAQQGDKNEPHQQQDDEDEDDLVFELFHRRRNQVLLLINIILILAVSFAATSAVSYKQYLLDAENFVRHQVKDRTPAQIGIELGKALSKLKGISDDGITPDSTFMGLPLSMPKLLKRMMLINYPLTSWKVSELTSRANGLVSSHCGRDNQRMNSSSPCSFGVSKQVNSILGSVVGSLSPNFVFGSYKGNIATSYSEMMPESSSMFDPVNTLNWASQQMMPNGQYRTLNLEGCQSFVSKVKSLDLAGVYIKYLNGNPQTQSWDFQKVKDQIASSVSMMCNEMAKADAMETTSTTTMQPTTSSTTMMMESTTTASATSMTQSSLPPGQTTSSMMTTMAPSSSSASNGTTATTIVNPSGTSPSSPSQTVMSTTVSSSPATTLPPTTTATTLAPLPTTFTLRFSPTTQVPTLAELQQRFLTAVLPAGSDTTGIKLNIVSNTTATGSSGGDQEITFTIVADDPNSSTEKSAVDSAVKYLNDAAPTTIASNFGASNFAPQAGPATTSSAPNGSPPEDGLPIAAIAGGAGGFVLLVIIVLVIYFSKRKKDDRRYHDDGTEAADHQMLHPDYIGVNTNKFNTNQPQVSSLAQNKQASLDL